MSEALKGLRIVELGTGPVTGIAGMVLADFGAEVLCVGRTRNVPLDSLSAAPMWKRGKQQLQLDLNETAALDELLALCAGADVFLSNWRMSALQRRGLDFESLHTRYPHLTYCHVSGFGNQGPLADLPGYEHVVAAYAGRMLQFQGIVDRPGPVFSALQVGVHATAQSAITGILAAQLQKGEDGEGRLVETSLLQGMLPYEMGSMIGMQFKDAYQVMLPYMQITPEAPPASLYYHPAQAADCRWIQFGNLLPHLFDNFLIATDLIDVLADPAYDAKQMLLNPAEKHEAFRERMLARIQERSASDWMETFIADGGIVSTTYQTTQQAMSDPDVVANGHVLERDDDSQQIGPLARLMATPATPGPAISDGKKRAARWRAEPRPAPTRTGDTTSPLSGIRIVELATIIAAPIGVSFLADMGAEVIKVEQIGGDPFRGLLAGLGAARVNAGKRSISLNLKSQEGQDVVRRLIKQADVLVHNYRPGVPEKLGFGYEDMSELNPNLIYLQSNGYGPDGPGANRPSTHPIPGAAMGGVVYQMGERMPSDLQDMDGLRKWTSRLMRANELNPDPNTGLVVASAVMLGLNARERTGRGQKVVVDMFGANAYANADDFIAYRGKPHRLLPDIELQGLNPGYRLYRCLDDTWVFLALISEEERQRFHDALTAAGADTWSPELMTTNSEAAATALETMFLTKPADDWQALLVPAGVACVRADRAVPADFWLSDEQVAESSFVSLAKHPVHGTYLRHGSLVKFDGRAAELTGPPLAGQHNESVLLDSGYDSSLISDLIDKGVVWSE